MKKIMIVFLAILAINSYAQTPYYDALKLRKYIVITDGKPKFIIPIAGDPNEADQRVKMKEYCDLINDNYYGGTLGTAHQIHLALSTIGRPEYNPFLAQFLTPGAVLGTDPTVLNRGFPGNLISQIGSLDVTTIADGFAKFIVERTKQELQAAFFDRFIELMQKDQYKDIRTLFPTTWSVIKRLPVEVYDYQKYIQALRDAFGRDMESILPSLEDVLRNGNYKDFFNEHLELMSVCLTALFYAKGLQQGKHIGQLIEEYNPEDPLYKFSSANADFVKTNAVKFVQEVSKSFMTAIPDTKEYWVTADSIRMLINDPVAFNIYLGLLYRNVDDIKVCSTSDISYGKVMATISDNINKLRDFIETVSNQIDNVQIQVQNFVEKEKKDRTIDDYIALFNSATRSLQSFKENELVRELIALLPPASRADVEFYWKKYNDVIDATNSVFSIYASIKGKNYSVAISNVRTLYEMRFEPAKASIADTGKKVQDVIDFLLDKGAFIAGVAQAKTSQEVYDAINMAAMPTGSARIKRLTQFNVALNAYCGLFVGYEKISGLDKGFSINTYGVTAPIGFSFSWGHKSSPLPFWQKDRTSGWSSTWFISLIDLGAVTAFRFTNETAEQVPTIQLEDIFSPGIFWSLGFPNTPISINLGAQVGPNLRKVTVNTNDYSGSTYVRFSLSVCVDIPVFNLYTKTK